MSQKVYHPKLNNYITYCLHDALLIFPFSFSLLSFIASQSVCHYRLWVSFLNKVHTRIHDLVLILHKEWHPNSLSLKFIPLYKIQYVPFYNDERNNGRRFIYLRTTNSSFYLHDLFGRPILSTLLNWEVQYLKTH